MCSESPSSVTQGLSISNWLRMVKVSGKTKNRPQRAEGAIMDHKGSSKVSRKDQKKSLSRKSKAAASKSAKKSPKAGPSGGGVGFPSDQPSDCPICGFVMSR